LRLRSPLLVALKELSRHNVVAVGDAENDHAFLRCCGCAAAVANAPPMLKETTDIQLTGARGAGVAELVEMICRDDAHTIPPERHGLGAQLKLLRAENSRFLIQWYRFDSGAWNDSVDSGKLDHEIKRCPTQARPAKRPPA